jgi:apoptosis-inducing factor 3
MSDTPPALQGSDLALGVAPDQLADGQPLLGHAGGEPVVLVRRGDRIFAIGATCSHYGGPLAEGLVVGETIRCPWHHACFSLATGEAVGGPALLPVARWKVTETGGKVVVGEKVESGWPARRPERTPKASPASVLIVGAGAAGSAAAEELRKQGYGGSVTLVDLDVDAPYDRPNLSKDYLAGNAPEEWIPLHPPGFYDDLGVEVLRREVVAIEPARHEVELTGGERRGYGALLLAPGAEPIRLTLEGDGRPAVRYLRTLADSRTIVADAKAGHRAVVLGASFIGLEVAASLRARGVEVRVVAPERTLFERVLGPDLGAFVQRLHQGRGVAFHLGLTARAVDAGVVTLSDGTTIEADLVVAGVGVRPRVALAEAAGLRVERGVVVDRYLRAGPDLYVVGDAARYPDPITGDLIRVEHWAAAQRQGQAAARNVLGAEHAFTDVPFFWSAHYDATIAYVGHAERWDRAELDGDPDGLDCRVRYYAGQEVRAVATIFRDRESLEVEAGMERAALARAG